MPDIPFRRPDGVSLVRVVHDTGRPAQPGDSGVDGARPVLERAYIDFAQSDALQLRLGKFLTPIGRWNQLHAAPLTWTTSRPLITEDTFPTNATGGMLRGVLPVMGDALEWSLFVTPGEELFREAGEPSFERAYGVRLTQGFGPHLRLGISVADFEVRSRRRVPAPSDPCRGSVRPPRVGRRRSSPASATATSSATARCGTASPPPSRTSRRSPTTRTRAHSS